MMSSTRADAESSSKMERRRIYCLVGRERFYKDTLNLACILLILSYR